MTVSGRRVANWTELRTARAGWTAAALVERDSKTHQVTPDAGADNTGDGGSTIVRHRQLLLLRHQIFAFWWHVHINASLAEEQPASVGARPPEDTWHSSFPGGGAPLTLAAAVDTGTDIARYVNG